MRIYVDGFIEQGHSRFSLGTARGTGVLSFGFEWGLPGVMGGSNPYQILVSEKKGITTLGMIKINAEWDHDIIRAIVELLSEGKRL